jgi:hypothetical protein
MNALWLARLIPKRKTDNNFLVKILSRFSATRLRSVLQLETCRHQYLYFKGSIYEEVRSSIGERMVSFTTIC